MCHKVAWIPVSKRNVEGTLPYVYPTYLLSIVDARLRISASIIKVFSVVVGLTLRCTRLPVILFNYYQGLH